MESSVSTCCRLDDLAANVRRNTFFFSFHKPTFFLLAAYVCVVFPKIRPWKRALFGDTPMLQNCTFKYYFFTLKVLIMCVFCPASILFDGRGHLTYPTFSSFEIFFPNFRIKILQTFCLFVFSIRERFHLPLLYTNGIMTFRFCFFNSAV